MAQSAGKLKWLYGDTSELCFLMFKWWQFGKEIKEGSEAKLK